MCILAVPGRPLLYMRIPSQHISQPVLKVYAEHIPIATRRPCIGTCPCTTLVFQVEEPFGVMRALFSMISIQHGHIRIQALETSSLSGHAMRLNWRKCIAWHHTPQQRVSHALYQHCVAKDEINPPLYPAPSEIQTSHQPVTARYGPATPDSVTHRPLLIRVWGRGARIGNCRDGAMTMI